MGAQRAEPQARERAAQDRLALLDKRAEDMTHREVKDTMANLQIEWPAFVGRLPMNPRAGDNVLAVRRLVESCAARFGRLASGAWPKEVLDDSCEIQPFPGHAELVTLTVSAMRRGICTLLCLFRHLELLARCEAVGATERRLGVMGHHYEASTSDFHLWYMHFQLPVAAKLNYKHDFRGMYNHVSQPVYFHNPGFERVARVALEEPEQPAIHMLPSLFQLYPDIPVRFEEENVDPFRKQQGWYWLLVPGRIYLVTPEPRVLYSQDCRDLLGFYLDQREFMHD